MKIATILGGIAGDVVGSVYEFNATKNYDFEIFDSKMDYTDDTIMTLAVANWLLSDPTLSHSELVRHMQHLGRKYPTPMGAYGGMFSQWLRSHDPKPYNSFGNGSAMRVSPVGFAFSTLEQTLQVAKVSAEVTHNHPEGVKGAQATAAAIFMARNGHSKNEIRDYIEHSFGYNLHRSYDGIKKNYQFEASCQETVPQSIIAFLESTSYEDALRLTVSLGGDADTMGAITGAIAVAFYGVMSEKLVRFVKEKLPSDLDSILTHFETQFGRKT